jgi:hypothetical protein
MKNCGKFCLSTSFLLQDCHTEKVDNISIEGVEKFKYLRTTLTKQISIQDEININDVVILELIIEISVNSPVNRPRLRLLFDRL